MIVSRLLRTRRSGLAALSIVLMLAITVVVDVLYVLLNPKLRNL